MFYPQITNGRSSIFNKPETGVRFAVQVDRIPHTAYRLPEKRTPFRLVAMKGDEMFRSIWENGERGTPEQWRN
ncbi:MAG TPA: hypothetical protein VFE71_04060 [Bacteroidales bacterium]|nr:hypothetical protein [Bacteroidales bacterium]